MKMVKKAGKMVPAFAADGKGKMQMGGASMTPPMMQSEMKKGGGSVGTKKLASKKLPKGKYGISMKPGMLKGGKVGSKKSC